MSVHRYSISGSFSNRQLANGTLANISRSRTTYHGHETHIEIHCIKAILAIGQNPSRNRVVIKDEYGVRNECTPEFFERFKEAFIAETEDFVECCLSVRLSRLTLSEARAATEVVLLLKLSFLLQRFICVDQMSFNG